MYSGYLRNLRYFAFTLLVLVSAPAVQAIDVDRPEVKKFIDQMVEKSDYDRASLNAILSDAKTQQTIIDAISRPAEKSKEWYEYRAIFITKERIKAGAAFWREHEQALSRISDETGVSREILVGIIGVETYYGRITGNYRVIDALSTLAFDYPPRSKFFSRELQEFLLLVLEEDMDAADATGSYAGAMGRPQFMPSSFRAYAVDGSDDGKRDIWNNWDDVIGSVANYFVRHHWHRGEDVVAQATLGDQWHGDMPERSLKPKATVESLSRQGVMFSTDQPAESKAQLLNLQGKKDEQYWVGFHNFFVITRYNTSIMYALAVHQLGQEISIEVNRDPS
jgi:membrane-bound lytic murein transglycosylase B